MKTEKFKVTPLERAWILYDVGNSAFVLMIATLVPIFFNALAEAGGVSKVDYLAYWGYASSIVTVVTAILGPILGTLADTKGFKKPIFMLCLFVGVIGCCAMGLAAQLLWKERDAQWAKWEELRGLFLDEIAKIPGACINSPLSGAPYIVNISIPGLRSETMIHFLEERGIYLSSGSACSKGARSHVLTAMGLPDGRIDSALRISMGKFTTREDILTAAGAIAQGAASLARRR